MKVPQPFWFVRLKQSHDRTYVLNKKKSYLQTCKVDLKQHFNPQIESLLTSYFKYDLETNSRWGYTEI